MERMKLTSAVFAAALAVALLSAQPPAGAPPAPGQGPGPGATPGRGRGGRGLPGATPEQTQAVNEMNAALQPLTDAVAVARGELAAATFAGTRNEAAVRAAVEKVRAAELSLAAKRAEDFAKLQAGPNKLNAEQLAALTSTAAQQGGRGGLPGGAGPGRGPQ
jgi:Spy/CpxP family protein refolding chaperone